MIWLNMDLSWKITTLLVSHPKQVKHSPKQWVCFYCDRATRTFWVEAVRMRIPESPCGDPATLRAITMAGASGPHSPRVVEPPCSPTGRWRGVVPSRWARCPRPFGASGPWWDRLCETYRTGSAVSRTGDWKLRRADRAKRLHHMSKAWGQGRPLAGPRQATACSPRRALCRGRGRHCQRSVSRVIYRECPPIVFSTVGKIPARFEWRI